MADTSSSSGDDSVRVDTTATDGTLTIRVEGEFDLAAVPHWEAAVTPLLDRQWERIDVDLARTTFMDSSGLGMLVRLRSTTQESAAELRILEVPNNVMRILEYSGVTALFSVSAAQLEPD